ncbi:HdeD family acid-resistance protein [Stenotrophomonas sp. JC08]|uniref:HdeD family acid-resistance protein n=1 Tax=Stenotrophomonas sp. JC08 TaxID=3445779 RepID=UPI003FA27814
MNLLAQQVRRGGWTLVVFGVLALVFAIATLLWPAVSVLAMVMTFGMLSLADGLVSLLSIFRKNVALPNWVLLLYALVSIGFGVLAISQPAQMAEAMMWLLALWLVIAGIARIVFAVQVRKLVNGEWMLALSGLLAVALGVLFFARPGIGLVTIALWVAVGALFYGVLQLWVGIKLLRQRRL